MFGSFSSPIATVCYSLPCGKGLRQCKQGVQNNLRKIINSNFEGYAMVFKPVKMP